MNKRSLVIISIFLNFLAGSAFAGQILECRPSSSGEFRVLRLEVTPSPLSVVPGSVSAGPDGWPVPLLFQHIVLNTKTVGTPTNLVVFGGDSEAKVRLAVTKSDGFWYGEVVISTPSNDLKYKLLCNVGQP